MPREKPTPALLKELLDYDPATGELFWKPRDVRHFCDQRACNSWNARFSGQRAFTAQTDDGYFCGGIFGVVYAAHLVVWAMQTGEWAADMVDHSDRDRSNNRWGNLREATNSENLKNSKSRAGSSSKYLGVSRVESRAKWRARIRTSRGLLQLGYFAVEEEAAKAYDTAAEKEHGAFANLNFPKEA